MKPNLKNQQKKQNEKMLKKEKMQIKIQNLLV